MTSRELYARALRRESDVYLIAFYTVMAFAPVFAALNVWLWLVTSVACAARSHWLLLEAEAIELAEDALP